MKHDKLESNTEIRVLEKSSILKYIACMETKWKGGLNVSIITNANVPNRRYLIKIISLTLKKEIRCNLGKINEIKIMLVKLFESPPFFNGNWQFSCILEEGRGSSCHGFHKQILCYQSSDTANIKLCWGSFKSFWLHSFAASAMNPLRPGVH